MQSNPSKRGWSAPIRGLVLALGLMPLAACLSGYNSFSPTNSPPTFLLSWLDANGPAESHAFERTQGRVRIESPYLSGTFTSALIRRRGVDPAVRLQLYPELGGRVLDLTATPYGFEGIIPPADIDVSWSLSDGKPPRHFFSFLAASLMEESANLSAERAIGAAPGPEHSWLVALTPNFEGLKVVATLDAHGILKGKEYTLRNVSWTQDTQGQRSIVGVDFRMTILEEATAPTDHLADSLFRLGPSPLQTNASSEGL
ncbi:MAG: hypothetical protein ACI82F_001942 [Planctomycetota bacterium]|jgi:hypothetical protein